jgi:dTMP kinase
MARGRLITIEGIDGAGKTTLATALAERIGARLLREPGGVAVAERIRDVVKDPALEIHPRTEALLYSAARAQLVHELLLPALDAGELILLDRFVDSSLAYQGAGRGLGVEAIAELNRFATAGVVPDRTLLLRVDPLVGRQREGARGEAADRLEQAPDEFFATVSAAYDDLAAADPQRIRVLDASRPADAVLEEALAQVQDLL